MKTLLLFTFLLGLSYSQEGGNDGAKDGAPSSKAVSCECGQAPSSKPDSGRKRIIGGTEATKHEFPWMAGLIEDSIIFCGAVVITKSHVMSSAHCTKDKTAPKVFVALGYDNMTNLQEENTQLIQAKEILNHENYDNPEGSTANDISIVVTMTEITFNSYVSPICFPTKNLFTRLDREKVMVAGWGVYEVTKERNSDKLLKVEQTVLPDDMCRMWGHYLRDQSQLCIYADDKNTCAGDSGGPAMWLDPESKRYTLVGLVSYGVKICGHNAPTAYANVSNYVEWALAKTRASRKELCYVMPDTP